MSARRVFLCSSNKLQFTYGWNLNVDRKRDSLVEAYSSRARLHSWRFREFCVDVLGLPEASEAEAV